MYVCAINLSTSMNQRCCHEYQGDEETALRIAFSARAHSAGSDTGALVQNSSP